jgi:prepilin-type N-terminal cleavage/methylation domain-containing protein
MNKRGFTLVELLVVIAIIALLMGILMPALARVRQIAFRMTCGTNLSGIGKAMLIYANDYDDELPRAGGRDTEWGGPVTWDAESRFLAYGLSGTDGTGGRATVSSSFYLLVKYAEVTPKSFICKGDAGTSEFKLVDYSGRATTCEELIDAWDFGGSPGDGPETHCSYAYHHPYSQYSLTTSSEPGMAVAADRNPWIESPAADAKEFPGSAPRGPFRPDMTPYNGTADNARYGNANAHQEDGQNVLFLDSHVNFEKRSYCGVEDDNIYTYVLTGNQVGSPIGEGPIAFQSVPGCRKDSFVVHDAEAAGGSRR